MHNIRFVCLDWGGTLMSENGPAERPMAYWPVVQPIEGARELLETLAPRYTLSVATNATVSRKAEIETALARAGLLEFIADVFCATDIGAKKDTAEFWSVVTRRLECRPDEISMLGDSLEQDVLGPASHGIYAVWFNPRSLEVPAGVRSVRELGEFATILRGIAVH